MLVFKTSMSVWREVSVLKSSGCSFQGSGLYSQHRQGNLQPSLTAVPGDGMPSSDLQRCQEHMWGMHMHIGNTLRHFKYR